MYRLQSDVLYFCLIKKPLNMNVFVNDTPVRTYYGAKVKSAVMAYFRDQNMSPKTVVKEVRDAYGNLIDMDGSIRANSKIYIKI
jgi:hypothetical protein